MKSNYDPVFLPNESIAARKYKVGDKIRMRVTEVMDDGVKSVCDHGNGESPMKEMGERTKERYTKAMNGDMEMD